MEILLAFIPWVVILGAMIFFAKVRKVPQNTVLIIDRNSHFWKKKHSGQYYTMNVKTDMITSRVSTSPVMVVYTNYFETHAGTAHKVQYMVRYLSEDIERTLSSLEDSRRSIYDILNCAVEVSMKSLTEHDTNKTRDVLNDMFFKNFESMLEPFYIDVLESKIYYISPGYDNSDGKIELFQKHVSSGENPIK